MLDNVRRVTKQVVTYGSADVALLVVNIVLLPLYAHELRLEVFGALGTLLACEAVLKVVFRWGLDESFLRLFYDGKNETDRRTLAGTIAICLATANGVIFVGLALASGVWGALWSTVPWFRLAFVLLVFNSFVSNFFFLPLTLYRAREQAGRMVAFTFTRSAATIAVRATLVLGLHYQLLGLMLADVIVTVAMTIALSSTYRSMIAWRFSKPLAREALNYGLPHVPYGLFFQAGVYADRLLLPALMPGTAAERLQQGGLYQMGSTIASMLKIVPVAFQTAWHPFAFDTVNKRADAARLFARLATYGFMILIMLTVGMIALVNSVVTLALPPSFRDTVYVVPLLAIGIAVQVAGWFPTTSLNIAKATRYYPTITAISAVATIVAEIFLIPRFGAYGAATGALTGQVVQSIAFFVVAQRVYPIPYETVRLIKVIGVGVATCLVAVAVSFASPIQELVARTIVVVLCFPAGLFLVRVFTTAELRDVRALVQTARSRIQREA